MSKAADFARVATRLDNLEQKYDENTNSTVADKLERLYRIVVGGATIHGVEDGETGVEPISDNPTVFDPGSSVMSLYMVLFGQRNGGGPNFGIQWLKEQLESSYNFNWFKMCFGDQVDTTYYDRWATDSLAESIYRLEDRMDTAEAAIVAIDGRVTALESAVADLGPHVDGLETAVSSLDDSVDTLNGQVSGHTTTLSDQASEIADIKSRLSAAGL